MYEPGGLREAAQKFCFLGFTYITHLFGLSRTRLNAIITIVLYLTLLHGIALLASARGLYLARHLSSLLNLMQEHTLYAI